jgi:integrase
MRDTSQSSRPHPRRRRSQERERSRKWSKHPRAEAAREQRARDKFGRLGDRFRTALTRACTAAGVPHFSPHDFRHRRVSLLQLGGVPWARIGELVGHDDLMTTARTYTHVVAEGELDYGTLLLG